MVTLRIAFAFLGGVGLLAGAIGAVVLVIRALRHEPLPRNAIAIVAALLVLSAVLLVGSGVRVVSSLSSGGGDEPIPGEVE